MLLWPFPCGSACKESTSNAGDLGSVPGLGRSPGEGKGTAAAAKSLQLCPTLCDSIDGSPPGFPIPGILQARTLEWVHHAKSWAGWITSWNQDCREKYQQLHTCRQYHSNGRMWRETKEPLVRLKEERKKGGLKLNIQKTKIMASGPTLQGK